MSDGLDLLGLLVKCSNFAAIKHAKQRRKDPEKTPYINHPIGKTTSVWLCLRAFGVLFFSLKVSEQLQSRFEILEC